VRRSGFFCLARPFSWLELQPGIQYWHHPAGIARTQDAWVTERKTVVTF